MTMTMTMTMTSCPYAQVTLLMKDVKAISKELHEQVRYATQSRCRTFTEATNSVEGKLDCQDKLWAAVVVLNAQTSRVLRQLGTSLTVFAKKNGK